MSVSGFSWSSAFAEVKKLGGLSDNVDYVKVESEEKYSGAEYSHAGHVMIYAKTSSRFLDTYDHKAIILMQMRFDGCLGFPGGDIDLGETPEEGTMREMKEEMGWREEFGTLSKKDCINTTLCPHRKLLLHFYALQVEESVIPQIEAAYLKVKDYGHEVLGMIRVPLYTMGDGFKGFPAFLYNNFVGNAKSQLLESIVTCGLLTQESVMHALFSQPNHIT